MRRLLVALVALLFVLPVAASLPHQNDAGSGGDAPNVRSDQVRVQPGVVYEASATGVPADSADWYAFDAVAGQQLRFRSSGVLHCSYLFGPSDTDYVGGSCAITPALEDTFSHEIDETGTWFVRILAIQPEVYRFSFALDATAPDPAFVPGITLFPAAGPLPPVSPATIDGPHSVIAVMDTGINPYHEFFRAPALQDAPSAWLDGFAHPVTALDLTFDAASVSAARAADAATWGGVRRSTLDDPHLYWFRGTRVLGISFGEFGSALTSPGVVPIYDENGHGTHSAGLAAGANLPVANGNVVVVMIEAGNLAAGIRWAARQPWIDGISVSIGTIGNLPVPGIEQATAEAGRAGKPIFIASGNGVTGTGVAPDHCTTYTSAWVGPAWVTRVGAAEPASANPTYWHCVPVEAIARTSIASPDTGSYSSGGSASGTSAATPNLAGHYGALLQEVRSQGSAIARDAALDHLLRAARPAPAAVALGAEPSLAATAPADQGYGLVDAAALARARDRILAGEAPEARLEMDAFRPVDLAIRRSLWGTPESPGAGAVSQDDAGSGEDAPDGRATAVPISAGVAYDGLLLGIPLDSADWYSFEAVAGQTVSYRGRGAFHCTYLFTPDPDQDDVEGGCAFAHAVHDTWSYTITTSGTWYIRMLALQPDAYRFGIGLDAPAPTL